MFEAKKTEKGKVKKVAVGKKKNKKKKIFLNFFKGKKKKQAWQQAKHGKRYSNLPELFITLVS